MTTRRTLRGGAPGVGGYRALQAAPGEQHSHRRDLADPPERDGQVLLTVAHLSDLHLCDAQSPARAELLDRWADPDSPVREQLEEVGTYRAQELLTAQVAEAMVRAVNEVQCGPVGAAPLDLAIVTGDNTDNAQANELSWYLAVLEGGPVRPDSGDLTRWEGVADAQVEDERFWHPETEHTDVPRERYGFPRVPGLLDAARALRRDRPARAVVSGSRQPRSAASGHGPRNRAAGRCCYRSGQGDRPAVALVKRRGRQTDRRPERL